MSRQTKPLLRAHDVRYCPACGWVFVPKKSGGATFCRKCLTVLWGWGKKRKAPTVAREAYAPRLLEVGGSDAD